MPDDTTKPPDWQRDNQGKARDSFDGATPGSGKASPPESEPDNPLTPRKEDRPKLTLHPKYAFLHQDNSGKPHPSKTPEKPRRHTQEQIDKWGECRRGELAKKHQAMAVEMKAQHDIEIKKVMAVYQQRVPGQDSPPLKDKTARHAADRDRLSDHILREEFNLESLIARAHETGNISDRDYVAELERKEPEKEAQDQEKSPEREKAEREWDRETGHDKGGRSDDTDDGRGR